MTNMKKILTILATLALMFAPFSAFASTSQMFTGTSATYLASGANMFVGLWGASGLSLGSSIGISASLAPISGTFKNFRANVRVPVTGAQVWTGTFIVNNSATALTCQITSAGNGTDCVDTTHTVHVAASSTVQFEMSPSGTPTASFGNATADFVPDVAGQTFLSAAGFLPSATVSSYAFFVSRSNYFATDGQTTPFSEGGTISNFYETSTAAPGAGASLSYTPHIAGVDGSVTCTISGTTGQCNDLVDTTPVVANNLVNMHAFPTNTPVVTGTFTASFEYTPTTLGDFLLVGGGGAAAISNTGGAVFYVAPNGGLSSTTEMAVQQVSNAMNVTGMSVSISNAPTGTNTHTYFFRDNGVSTGLSCTIATTNKTCSATGLVKVNAGDLIDTVDDIVGSPTANTTLITYTANENPPPPTLLIRAGTIIRNLLIR